VNTVKIGDEFEAKSKKLIRKIIDNQELSITPAHCTVKEKVKYYSVKRRKDIIFDLSIEVKHPKADKPFLVCIVECKNLNKPVPVDDIEEFESKVSGIQEFQTKKIVIAKNDFQSGSYDVAKTLGITLINVNEDDYKIILYKANKRLSEKEIRVEEEIENLIKSALLPEKIEGLKSLSAKEINNIAVKFLNKIDTNVTEYYLKTPLSKIRKYLEDEMSIQINESSYLVNNNGDELLGYYDIKNQIIYINSIIKNTIRFPFVFAHEIGHLLLHNDLKANQFTYDNFKDSEYNLFVQKNILINDKNWIEWQANCFSASLLMPTDTIIARLISIQSKMGISKQGRIYLDNQKINKEDFRNIVYQLATFFQTSKTSVEYRLESLGLIERPAIKEDEDKAKDFLRKISLRNNIY
jgi:Zn-dependent peptidase ImmA (M78 family)